MCDIIIGMIKQTQMDNARKIIRELIKVIPRELGEDTVVRIKDNQTAVIEYNGKELVVETR
jgi:hypothetical protein